MVRKDTEEDETEQLAKKDMEEDDKTNTDCTTIEALFKEISTRKELELKLQKVSKVPQAKHTLIIIDTL